MSDLKTEMKTGRCRLSYANLLIAKAAKGSTEAKFGTVLMIPKTDTETYTEMKKIEDGLVAQTKAKHSGKLPKGFKRAIKDGDLPDENGDIEENYKGHWLVSANSKNKPEVYDKAKRLLTTDAEIYSGMYCKALVNFYYFDKGTTGIGCGLNLLLKMGEGEKFGGNKSSIDDFDDSDFDDADDDFGAEDSDDDFS